MSPKLDQRLELQVAACTAPANRIVNNRYVLDTYHNLQLGASAAHHKTVETIAILKQL